jgi:hypothetical protein
VPRPPRLFSDRVNLTRELSFLADPLVRSPNRPSNCQKCQSAQSCRIPRRALDTMRFRNHCSQATTLIEHKASLFLGLVRLRLPFRGFVRRATSRFSSGSAAGRAIFLRSPLGFSSRWPLINPCSRRIRPIALPLLACPRIIES